MPAGQATRSPGELYCGQLGKGEGKIVYRSPSAYDGWMKLETGGTIVRTTIRAGRVSEQGATARCGRLPLTLTPGRELGLPRAPKIAGPARVPGVRSEEAGAGVRSRLACAALAQQREISQGPTSPLVASPSTLHPRSPLPDRIGFVGSPTAGQDVYPRPVTAPHGSETPLQSRLRS
jgi:hypothetical protein